jgi:hypothetical protein
MAFNNINFLMRVIEVQNIVLEYKDKDVSQKWIYENLIKERFYISKSTFNRYLAVNAKKELKTIQRL